MMDSQVRTHRLHAAQYVYVAYMQLARMGQCQVLRGQPGRQGLCEALCRGHKLGRQAW